MKKIQTQMLLLILIAASSSLLNGMLASRLRQAYQPGRTVSTRSRILLNESITPETDKLKTIPGYLPQTWYQKLFGIKKINPAWTAQVERVENETDLIHNPLLQISRFNEQLDLTKHKLESQLHLIEIIEKSIRIQKKLAASDSDNSEEHATWKKENAAWIKELISDAANARYRLHITPAPFYSSWSDYGYDKVEEDTKYILKLKAETLEALNKLKSTSE